MNLPLFLARRLYSDEKKSRHASQPAVRIAIAGVAVGVAVMLISVSIAQGFRSEISGKVTGFGSHILIINVSETPEQTTSPISVTSTLLKEIKSTVGVAHVQAFTAKAGMLKTDENFVGITFKGIGPDYDTAFLASHIIDGRMPRWGTPPARGQIVISHATALRMKLHAGQRVFAYFFTEGAMRTRRMTVAAIYRTDLTQFDETLVFADRSAVGQLCGFSAAQASGLEVLTADFSRLDITAAAVARRITYQNIYHQTQISSYSIRELYPQIFSWLDLLGVNITVILALMLLLSGVTIVSSLLILILERTSTIALLKSLGAPSSLIRRTFISLAALLLARGMIIGNAAGLALAAMQWKFHIVDLDPEKYYIDSVPIDLSLRPIILINVATAAISLLALVVPSWLTSRVRPSEVLRFE